MKKFFFYILVLFFGIFNFNFVFAQDGEDANFCSIDSAPAESLINYYKNIENELKDISENTEKDSSLCGVGNYQKVTSVFNLAFANIAVMDNLVSDFGYNIKVAWNGDTPKAISRDEKIFSKLEKQVERTANNLARKCALNDLNKKHLSDIVIEINELRGIYQQSTLGIYKSVDSIRPQNQDFARQIQSVYGKYATSSCEPTNPKSTQGFFETLNDMFNLGAKKEKSLETWKNAAALITSSHSENITYRMLSKQRSILQAELSRQGLSPNVQRVMMDNFTCYKSKTSNSENILNLAEARLACADVWVTGVEESSGLFKDFVKSSKNTDEFARRQDSLIAITSRSVDVYSMYSKLDVMLSTSAENNDSTHTNLVKLHSALVFTNEMLEKRIPKAQANCMKGNPDLVGGCK